VPTPRGTISLPRDFHLSDARGYICPARSVILSRVSPRWEYRPRIADSGLRSRLDSAPIVVIEGPKACGKTATARQVAASEALLDVDEALRAAAAIDPALVLEGPAPRLIDEWQIEPAVWNHVRRAADDRGRPGQFILTGSAVPADDITRHTGAGRISRLRMRPMTLFEAGHASGTVSLSAVMAGQPAPAVSQTDTTLADIADLLVTGGWPGHLGLSPAQATRAARDYLDEIRRVDIGRVDDRRRDPERVGRVLRSLARHTATHASSVTVATDAGGPDGTVNDDTVREYVGALERLMVVEDQPAWAPHLRSRSVLRSSPTHHFVDPSLAVAALGATPASLLRDTNLFGLLFESLVVRDLRVYAGHLDGRVLGYRDNTGLEVDVIVETADGRWGAFEIKLGGRLVEDAAAGLLRFVDRVDTSRVGPAAILAVITATGYGYVRPDGIAVIPITALGP
jgi:predicted AAA+ superfamily ATPase